MGKISVKENKSIYQRAREEKGYSRAEAAEIMDCGMTDNRLVRIEDDIDSIRPEEVCAMARAYGRPELRNHYCVHQCAIGKHDIPAVEFNDNIHEILVNLVVSIDNVNHRKVRLLEILSNGEVGYDERNDFNTIQSELEKITAAVEALQIWCEKMKVITGK